jgi:eukaryotic-like serine/threonine-protein kinase
MFRETDQAPNDLKSTVVDSQSVFHQTVDDAMKEKIGRFSLVRLLGRGAFGSVFEAFDPLMDRSVALKIANSNVCNNPLLRERFFREIHLASKLVHPGIVRLYEAGEEANQIYFTMELGRGSTLSQWLDDPDKSFSPIDYAKILAKVAHAVHFGHVQGVVHRDLKPDNLLVEMSAPGEYRIQVLDFGLAFGPQEAIRQTTASVLMGTPLYMSPEQVMEEPDQVGPSSDIFSLGTILYECLTGVTPFAADTLPQVLDRLRCGVVASVHSLRPEIPQDIETICLKCLAMEPEQRYATAEALAMDLEAFASDLPIQAKRVGRLRRFRNWMKQPLRFQEFGLGLITVNLLVLGWSIVNYPIAMLLFPNDVSDRVDHNMFLPMVLLIIPIHSLLLWSSFRVYGRRLSRRIGTVHLLATLFMAVVAVTVICMVPSTPEMQISRFQRVGALGLIASFAEVQSAIMLLLLSFGRWPRG